MIVHNCQQGSQEWLELRAGIPTASQFDKIITPGGAPSKSASDYCNRLIAERMLGRPLIGITMPWMQRGKDMEAEAVKYYEFIKDVETVPVGHILTDDGRIGASPDRLVGDGLLEVKCPSDEVATKYLSAHIDALLGLGDIESGVYAAYKCQVQGELYVSGRAWCDVMSYYPGLPSAITRIGRDEKFLAAMEKLLYQFLDMFDTRLERLRQLGYLDGATAPKSSTSDVGELGITDVDVDQYIAALKQRGVL